MKVKTYLLCYVSISHNLCLELQTVKAMADALRRRRCNDSISVFSKLQKLFTVN